MAYRNYVCRQVPKIGGRVVCGEGVGWLVGKSPEIWERIKPSWGHQITGSDGLDGVFFILNTEVKKTDFWSYSPTPKKHSLGIKYCGCKM